jgi:hypothetical protein
MDDVKVNRCRVCKTPLQSRESLLCVRCYRWNMIQCPECVQGGKRKEAYRNKVKNGTVIHRAKRCGTCGDYRLILRDPLIVPPD